MRHVLVGIDDLVPAQYVGRLPEDEPEIRPLELHVSEVHEPLAAAHPLLDECRVVLDEGRAHPGLHPALQLDELDLHRDRARQFRMLRLEGAQFGDFSRLDAAGRAGAWLVGHTAILA